MIDTPPPDMPDLTIEYARGHSGSNRKVFRVTNPETLEYGATVYADFLPVVEDGERWGERGVWKWTVSRRGEFPLSEAETIEMVQRKYGVAEGGQESE